VLGRLRPRFGFSLAAHGVDHGLRAAATEELAHAEQLARTLGVPFGVTRLSLAPGGNLQARAREERRAAVRDAARSAGARLIATGHTADDRAETFLLRLLRGAGPRGLAVMPPSAPLDAPQTPALLLIRPLLLARRADVAAHLGRHEIPFARDPSNDDARFLRVRVRAELLPLLESMSPGIAEHLCSLADMLAAELPAGEAFRDLGRAQRLAVARAKKCERPVKLRLSGGREVTVAFSGDEPVLIEKPQPRGP
jgi:tRNA(Ile)-lysidine synthase